MPFAKYKDFKSCVAANSDKRDPSAYCASIERKIIGKAAMAKKAAAGRRKNYSKGAVSLARKMSK